MSRFLLAFASFAAAALLGALYWAHEGRLEPVPPAGIDRAESVSFSPYRPGQSPLAQISPTLDEISADLAVLSGRVEGVRTYTALEGLDAVPRFARPLGLHVMLGIWVGREPEVNEREIASGVALAARYPEVVREVIVGNEVMLRRDLTAAELAGYLDRVKAAVRQPVTYADVWEFWLKNPELAAHVDFITIHILPYWEDKPIAIEDALEHVETILKAMQAAFPGKRIVIGEVGWPSSGRMREGALPSRANEARLIRGFVRLARAKGMEYNLFEAFDETWKHSLEGTVGGHWGLFNAAREEKFALDGPVSNDPAWGRHFAYATTLAGLAALLVLWRGPAFGPLGWLAFSAAAELLGTILTLAGRLIDEISWSPFDWIVGGLGLAANVLLSALLLGMLAAALDGRRWPAGPLPTAEEAINFLRGRPLPGPTLGERTLGLLQFGFIVAAAVVSVSLVVDPRYRDFPSEAFLIPALGFAALALFRARPPLPEMPLREEALLATLLLLGAVGVAIGEGPRNTQALGWCGVLLLLALPWVLALNAMRRRGPLAPAAPLPL